MSSEETAHILPEIIPEMEDITLGGVTVVLYPDDLLDSRKMVFKRISDCLDERRISEHIRSSKPSV